MSTSRNKNSHLPYYQNEMVSMAQCVIIDLLGVIEKSQEYFRNIPREVDFPRRVLDSKKEFEDHIFYTTEYAANYIHDFLVSIMKKSLKDKKVSQYSELPFRLRYDLETLDRQCNMKLSKMGIIREAFEECAEQQ